MLTHDDYCATLPTEAAAEMLRLNERKVRALCRRGHLKTLPRKEGEPYHILLESLHRLVSQSLEEEHHDMHPHPMPAHHPMEVH